MFISETRSVIKYLKIKAFWSLRAAAALSVADPRVWTVALAQEPRRNLLENFWKGNPTK